MNVLRRSLVLLAMVAASAAVAFACSSEKSDGASCEEDSDCKSGTCAGGRCAGASCSCSSTVCDPGAGCEAGWVCAKDDVTSGPRCRLKCKEDEDCLSNERCDDGRCKGGGASVVLSWKHLPRRSPCRAYSECPFEVGVGGGTGVARYEWSFSNDEPDAGPTVTQEPTITHKYGPGTAKTRVNVVDKSGSSASIETTDDICVDGKEIKCVADRLSCCFGSCTPTGECR
jgi:hypothetical protein